MRRHEQRSARRVVRSPAFLALALIGAWLVARHAPAGPRPSPVVPAPSAHGAWIAGAGLSASPGSVPGAGAPADEDLFPHEDHAGLFPVCTGCHLAAETDGEAALYPEPESCVTCHDGVVEDEVVWTGPTPLESNLDFDHLEHISLVAGEGDPAVGCEGCHGDPGPEGMTVSPLEAESCIACHDDVQRLEAGRGADQAHLVRSDCAECHVRVVDSNLSWERLRLLPVPPDHEPEAYLGDVHGPLDLTEEARCATCHVQDQCADCHVNARDVPEIQRLPTHPESRPFPPLLARYPTPTDHEASRWPWDHAEAPGPQGAECATCHVVETCTLCHVAPVPAPFRGLTPRDATQAPGAAVEEGRQPPSHESPFFGMGHGILASAQDETCATCHEPETFCSTCHERTTEASGFHPPSYVMSHAVEAASAVSECSNCHDVTDFCRTCHVELGFESRGRLSQGYHDAEPVWLLRHAQAARQQLESCASCHTQRQCLQCHSTVGAFSVSPHGPGFDARRAWEANPVVCRACHVGDPFGGGV